MSMEEVRARIVRDCPSFREETSYWWEDDYELATSKKGDKVLRKKRNRDKDTIDWIVAGGQCELAPRE